MKRLLSTVILTGAFAWTAPSMADTDVNWDGTVGEFLSYCDVHDDGCAFALDTVLNQVYWGHACKESLPGYQIDDGKVLIVNWLRANEAPSYPIIDGLADATKALTSSLCAPQ